ncbi:hypothetical protein [Flavicella sediminum]|uniref:hypothetical protein n=1 Tax=Flavicella sediminum TaxID=2585141 RepID=UPI00111F2090|nr:hypothetical protein [Flavicella sediminum]
MTVTEFRNNYILGFGYDKKSKTKKFRLVVLFRQSMHIANEVIENDNNTCFKQFLEGKDLNKAILKFKTDAIAEILEHHKVTDYNLSESEINRYFE